MILPPIDQGAKALATTPYMQFFLAPRQVLNCNDLACAQNLSRENTYILIVNGFPGSEVEQSPRQRLMFDQAWGVLLPGDSAPTPGSPLPAYKSLLEMGRAAVWPVFWLLVLTGCGYLWVQLLIPSFSLALKGALGYGLGLSLFSFLIALVSLIGVRLGAGASLGVTAFLVGLSCLAGYWNIRKTRTSRGNHRAAGPGSAGPGHLAGGFLSLRSGRSGDCNRERLLHHRRNPDLGGKGLWHRGYGYN